MTDIAEYRGKSPDELKELALNLKKELFNLRFQVAAGENNNSGRFRAVRRDIARIKTVMNEPKDAGHAPVKKARPAKEAKAPKEAKAAKEPKESKEPKAKKAATKKKASGE